MTIALFYATETMIPLAAFFISPSSHTPLIESVALNRLALLVFGNINIRFTTARPFRSDVHTVFVGAIAASAALLMAKAIG